MKVKATYRLTFEVTREVEVDDADFEVWKSGRMWSLAEHDRSLALASYLDQADDELTAEVFEDWRADRPLPSDFEFQEYDVVDVELEPQDLKPGASENG